MINSFRGKYSFLSNFYDAPVEYLGITYKNSEAAYQAQKLPNPKDRKNFENLTAPEAKKLGKQLTIRDDWEEVKTNIMYEICLAKFTQNPELMKKLIETRSELLVEGNTWGDSVWGMCNGIGENWLGKILMHIRGQHYKPYSKIFEEEDEE